MCFLCLDNRLFPTCPIAVPFGVMFRVVMVCMDLIAVVFLAEFCRIFPSCLRALHSGARKVVVNYVFVLVLDFMLFLLLLLFFAVLLKPCFSRLITPAWPCAQ